MLQLSQKNSLYHSKTATTQRPLPSGLTHKKEAAQQAASFHLLTDVSVQF